MLFEELTPEEDWVYQWQYGYLGDFHSALFDAIKLADEKNLYRLWLGFPDEVNGYKKYTREEGWWQKVKEKVASVVGRKSQVV